MARSSRSKNRRPKFDSRPLYAAVFALTLLASFALFLGDWKSSSTLQKTIFVRDREGGCEDVRHAGDQCAFVRANCIGDEPGLLSYLTFYYCAPGNLKPISFAILALWLGLLFSTIGIAASDFFSINLSTIASVFGLPESLAGVTFLAFGNGSPDVFSTFAAMNSNSGGMAIGELIGAAGFISAVVAGSMALVREFKVNKKTFVRDIVFFICAVSFTMVFLTDGKMHLWECGFMIAFYVFYVCFVVAWHWFSSRKRKSRNREVASRNHYSAAFGQAADEVEPYQDGTDDEEEDERDGGRRGPGYFPDITALEASPRIRENIDRSPQDEDYEDQSRHIASEMTSSMRVNRPRGRRSHTTITPIRPSLIGALEFRSVLSSLQRSRNMRMASLSRAYSDYNSAGILAQPGAGAGPDRYNPYTDDAPTTWAPSRNRALSSGDVPRNLQGVEIRQPLPTKAELSAEDAAQLVGNSAQGRASRSPSVSTTHSRDDSSSKSAAHGAVGDRGKAARAPSPAVSTTIGGHLAPPGMHPQISGPFTQLGADVAAHTKAKAASTPPPSLSLQIPDPYLEPSQTSSPSVSPFPVYIESPVLEGQQSPQRGRSRSMLLPPPLAKPHDHIPGLDPPESPKPLRWWPYNLLPPPHVLWRTMLPTLEGWQEKSIWDKIFSVFSLLPVFMLVLTVPVVETEDDCAENEIEDDGHSVHPPGWLAGGSLPVVAIEGHTSVVPETEWQEYRRRAYSVRSRSSSTSQHWSTAGVTPQPEGQQRLVGRMTQPPASPRFAHALSVSGGGSEPTYDNEPSGWNRWLVGVQIFTGPLFTVLVIWAKYMDQPVKTLVKMILYSMLVSLILLAVLLLVTSRDHKSKYHPLFCFLGFIISVAWISTIAEEVVGVLKAVGVILGMSEAILGLTVFAVGNSIGDLVADITVARLGHPVMALSACFGGPMLNILLGIGLGGTYMSIKGAKHHHRKHPDEPLHYKSYRIDVTGTLFISAITVLATLVTLLMLVPASRWMMTRKTGLTLIALWTVGTIFNVVVEVTGVWKALS